MPRKSAHSPSKGGSPPSHHSAQASWSDADTHVLLDLVATQKAKAGDGLNFKTAFWNAVAAGLCNPTKGVVKSSNACKEKWKRLRKTYELVTRICNTSGFAYSLESGVNVQPESEDIWTVFLKNNKDANSFKNKGWPYYERMKQFMPSQGKGLN
ncbi:hypothetical protein SCLCIDRAFT_124873, partial [Scleroderma citrinum Foug A]